MPESSSLSQNTNAWIGGVVGALVTGLFIGFVASFLIIWRQTRGDELGLELANMRTRRKNLDSRGLTISSTLRADSITLDLDQFLALPVSNKDLVSELTSLGHLIQQHVENHYHLSSMSQDPGSLSEGLSDLGLTSTKKGLLGPVQLGSMAIDTETRHVALQHIITRVIFASMSVESMRNSLGKLSLLPASVTSVIKSVAPCEQYLGNQKAVSVALTRWRHLSAFLLNPKRSDRGFLVPDELSLGPQAQEIVNALSSALGAFVDNKDRADQEKHLMGVVLECTKLGYMVLSQPAEYVYDFVSPDEKEVVVCPGLQKVSDDYGVECQPETVVAPERHTVVSEA